MNIAYNEYLKSDDWFQKRKLRRNHKTGSTCSLCHSMENLEVHHLVYKNLFDVEQKDLRVLCRMCHLRVHDLYKSGKIRFRNNEPNHRFGIIQKIFKFYYPECHKNKGKAKKVERTKRTLDIIVRTIKNGNKDKLSKKQLELARLNKLIS